ncbi:MAG: hypothetical protein WBO29_00860, partial [Albidovulum sp.]
GDAAGRHQRHGRDVRLGSKMYLNTLKQLNPETRLPKVLTCTRITFRILKSKNSTRWVKGEDQR